MEKFRGQAGFSLIEILVAVLITAIGLLGIASLQASAISTTTTSNMRTTAAISTQSLVARMRANKAYWRYELAETDAPTGTITIEVTSEGGESSVSVTNSDGSAFGDEGIDCAEQACSPREMAFHDMRAWMETADQLLVEPNMTLSTLPAGESSLQRIRVILTWKGKKLGGETVSESIQKAFSDFTYIVTVRI